MVKRGELKMDPILDMYIFETTQLMEQLEQIMLNCEKDGYLSKEIINEIFRIMHTTKGSAAMMFYNNISNLAHSLEDIFDFLREEENYSIDYLTLTNLILEAVDFIKGEVEKIINGNKADGDSSELIEKIKCYLIGLKENQNSTPKDMESNQFHTYEAVLHFEEGCQMEDVRSFAILHKLRDYAVEVSHIPKNIMDNANSVEIIRREGFKVNFKSQKSYDEIKNLFLNTLFLKDLKLKEIDDNPNPKPNDETQYIINNQNAINVNVNKLDMLMDLVGEMVIAEAMVVQNPDLKGLELNNFKKSARQLNKIISEIQDTVMEIRMVPLEMAFHRMHRIVRDMCHKLNKEVQLEIIGEDTEVDKNIIEHISDPLMHLVRNAIDHGIESAEVRQAKGKPKIGTITLEAKNIGSDVLIIIKDDGKGLNRDKILKKAIENGLLNKNDDEMSNKDVFNLITLPGFSTKDEISEFSGRGVGMDVVMKNIEIVGGTISINSIEDEGTVITIKIPLTLAIIDGMNLEIGHSKYTLPTTSIKEFFRAKERDIITDPYGNEMIMVRGNCCSILRLHKLYGIQTDIEKITDGILIMVEWNNENLCIFVDKLLGQQQVVVKTLPEYIRKFKKIKGISGCTLLGDGNISLILDVAQLINL